MLEIHDTHERHVGNDLGIKVRLSEAVKGPEDYSRIGERVASHNSTRASSIWVWVFAHDMDIEGPAVCVTHLVSGRSATEFIDPAALLLYYSLKGNPESDEAVADGGAH